MPDAPLIDIRNAEIWRGGTRVFESLTLRIEQHERVAIIGPNGSGKTTLLKTINRELYPVVADGSWVRILGRERWNVWELRKHIGVVSDDLHRRYPSATTALEVLLSGFHASIGVHGIIAARVTAAQHAAAERTLALLDIADLKHRSLRSMSTGQRRRCLLGRALVHDPDTLIFDEPTTGLDLAGSFELLARIRALAAERRNILIVTHQLNEIPPDVERVILLDNGRIAADGDKPAVLTETTLSAVYRTAIRVARIDGHYLAYPGQGAKRKT